MKKPLDQGLYELIITPGLEARLGELKDGLVVARGELHPAEAAERIAHHIAALIERTIESVGEDERQGVAVRVARELLVRLGELIKSDGLEAEIPIDPAGILQSIVGRNLAGRPMSVEPPLIPLRDTTLLINAPGEPRVGRQIEAEIASADSIDVLMAFIRFSGVQPLTEALRRNRDRREALRIITTIYTGSTERRALDVLKDLGAEIRVSYDKSSTRLHAKAWMFHRHSGFSTAYIGSSNLTYSAQVTGLEWNIRASQSRNPDVIEKVVAAFDSYWEQPEFVPYDPDEFSKRIRDQRPSGPSVILSPVEIRPTPFQQRLLEQIAVSRELGFHRNLLAAATGTGKTVMAALDYARLRAVLPRTRLLFIAHRQEILDQSRATFRYALRDADFGERWVAGDRPETFEHVFASIQSFNQVDLANIAPEHFDVVIVDEFHHAAAKSYEKLLTHVQPRELLGLTATPERTDGAPILQWFGNRIAAELRLWDAIDQQYLVPFAYYGTHDGVNLTAVPWRRGVGYDPEGLTNLYTASDAWARRVIKEFTEHIEDPATARTLGFCVSVEHARYMSRIFNECGVRSVAVWGDSSDEERAGALLDLRERRINVLFSVDLFNEGVDLPSIDTLLLLRPTDSPTLFLQQLGRGLRRAEGKTTCTVLDFVGIHRDEFRFDRRLRALLGGTRGDVLRQVEQRFPFLPAGCHMELDSVASQIVLANIRQAVPSRWTAQVQELRSLIDSGREASLAAYLETSGLELEDLYSGTKCWSDLCADAGRKLLPVGPEEGVLRKAIGRLLHVDDESRLSAFAKFASLATPVVSELSSPERRMLRMFVASLLDQAINNKMSFQEGVEFLWKHPQILSELSELVPELRQRLGHLGYPLAEVSDVPLRVHARYTRREILAALDEQDRAKVPAWQTGVRWLPKPSVDAFAFTLDKTDGKFSPTTRYRDYAISPNLIHWESQSVTRQDSETGLRYQQHVARGSHVLLFARLRQSDRAFWFLGPARYIRHVGECPMAVTWELKHALPADLFSAFAAVAGA